MKCCRNQEKSVDIYQETEKKERSNMKKKNGML